MTENRTSRVGPALALALRGRHLLVLDLLAVTLAYFGSYFLRFDLLGLLVDYVQQFAWVLPILLVVRPLTFVAFGLYQRVWRYASIDELRAIISAVVASTAVGYGIAFGLGVIGVAPLGIPRSIPFVDTLLLLALVGGLRFSFVAFRIGRRGPGEGNSRTLIVGAGAAGVAVARQILTDPRTGLRAVGFADDQEAKGHRLLGLRVLGSVTDLQELVRAHGIGTVLFALPTADGPTLRRLVRIAEREGAKSLTVPSLSEVVSGQISSSLREVQVDDLLRRAPASIDLASMRDSFAGKTILVTGAGGSIGSELSRQLARYGPHALYLLGRGENSIYEIAESLATLYPDVIAVPVILDVRDRVPLKRLFLEIRPDAVFHAAAHKHVTFMERYPAEAVWTNVAGTRNVIEACEAADVDRLVLVSTDKAVQPMSVMGATKRVCELQVRDAARRTGRRYVVVRFGNVLSSRGSVLPRFRRQLAAGGPITVTHPQVRRYFMTIPEAVQLILQSAAVGAGGETFVLDMGDSVRIDELARDLIEMHGLVPGKDIQIVYTGLQSGEKLDEELFLPTEQPRKTTHESLWTAEGGPSDLPVGSVERLEQIAASGDPDAIRAALREIVPEYRAAQSDAVPEWRTTD
ncbi:MAG TPA: nucleoside-diphosphate sugar epimerase/dehydratase [Candidatus Limnocylindria bacterium]|nr:nucleoside-diphosphate sugar epimerase/dehydratase [Candidatus Limnocylindria bacterium]